MLYRHRAASAVIAAMLAVAGCGGASHDTTHPPASTATSAAGPSAHSPTFGLPPRGVAELPPVSIAVPTLEMDDSVTVSAIPSTIRAVAGYLPPSSWPTYGDGQLARAFPHAIRVPVAVQASVVIRGVRMGCLDVEPRDATPSQVPGWIRAEIAAHVKPCVYSNLSEWTQIRNYLAVASLPRHDYFAWLAYWTFHPGLVAGYDAVQWTDRALSRNLDESTVSAAFLNAPAPKPRPSKAQIAKWTRARDASERAYDRQDCPTFAQRERWFAARLTGPKAARHRRALTASRTVYQQRGCVVFAQRVKYFNGKLR